MKILFVRHAESEKNIGEKFDNADDQKDTLTRKGLVEVDFLSKFLGQFLAEGKNAVFITGNRKRTIESTQQIAKLLSYNFFISTDLLPINPGSLSGLTYDESFERFPELMERRKLFVNNLISGYDLVFPKGDLFKDYELRIKTCVENIIQEYQSYETIFIITHRSVILAVLNIYYKRLGLQEENIYKYYSTPGGYIVEIDINASIPTRLVSHGGIDEWNK